MIRWIGLMLLMACVSPVSRAHFVFVVPQANGSAADVILSEDLKADDDVDVAIIGDAQLSLKNGAGIDKALKLVKGEHGLTVDIAGEGMRVVHGTADLGVKKRGDSKPFRLVYHPKTVIGDGFDPKATLGSDVPAEIVPVGKSGALQFKLLIKGQPASAVEINVVLPDGKKEKAVTDAQGVTRAFDQRGRYGAWARYFEPAAGEIAGAKYEEVRHYPTLVVELPQVAAIAPLPRAVSSFGAVACDGWMYVYGGHTAATHHYSTQAVSPEFHRLNLADGKTWEELPGGPGLQGMNLATYKGKIYRVGGMEPRNKPDEKADNYSVADCARFDPKAGKWEALLPLPQPRSSHDVAVVDGKLYVLGGWNMRGRKAGNDWLGNMEVLDLEAPNAKWKEIQQPFERRALIAAVNDGRIYAIGGFSEESDPSLDVEVYDTKSGIWTKGPRLPGKALNGFAPAACAIDGRVYASVGDGSMLRLDEAGKRWEKIASTTPRIVHRLIPHGAEILVVGGASKGENLNLIEVVPTGGGAAPVHPAARRDTLPGLPGQSARAPWRDQLQPTNEDFDARSAKPGEDGEPDDRRPRG